jgi:hypothetical protein
MRRDVLDQGLLGGDADVISDIYRNRVLKRGKGSESGAGAPLTASPMPSRRRRPGRNHDGTHIVAAVALGV